MSIFKNLALLILGAAVLSACASSQMKARKEQRDKIAQTSHLYCEFVNGETYPDVDVAVNLEMAKHCDSNGQMTLTSYRSPSEAIGLVYCCSVKEEAPPAKETKASAAAAKLPKPSEAKLDKPSAPSANAPSGSAKSPDLKSEKPEKAEKPEVENDIENK